MRHVSVIFALVVSVLLVVFRHCYCLYFLSLRFFAYFCYVIISIILVNSKKWLQLNKTR